MLAFLFIGGWGNVKKQYVGSVGAHRCPACNQVAEWKIYDVEKRATVFFVPVLKYSSKRVVICSHCGAGTDVGAAEIAELSRHPEVPPASNPADGGSNASEEQQYRAAGKRVERDLRKEGGFLARMSGRRTRRQHPELAGWVDLLQRSLGRYGYTNDGEDAVTWGEDFRGVLVLVSADFRDENTSYKICVFRTSREALLYAMAMNNDPISQKGRKLGVYQLATMDRRVYLALGDKVLQPGKFGRWTQAAGSVALPS